MTLANKLSVQQEAVTRVDLAVRAEKLSRIEHAWAEQNVLDAIKHARAVDVKMVDLIALTGFSRSGLYAKLATQPAESTEDEDLPQ